MTVLYILWEVCSRVNIRLAGNQFTSYIGAQDENRRIRKTPHDE